MFKRFFQKRESNELTEARSFVPINSLFGETGSYKYSPVVDSILSLYSRMLDAAPLECDKDCDLLKLLNTRPCPWMSRQNFFEILCEQLLLNSNFYAVVKGNGNGVEALLPYNTPEGVSAWASGVKPKEGSQIVFDDPIELFQKGKIYKDFRGRVFSSDEMLHIADLTFNKSNQLEGYSKMKLFAPAFNAAVELSQTLENICARRLKSNAVLSGFGYVGEGNNMKAAGAKEVQQLKKDLKRFYESDSAVLALPPGYKLDHANYDRVDLMVRQMYELNTQEICRILNVPFALISGGLDERGQKEARRFFISGAFSGFCKKIEEAFNELTNFEISFKFNLDKLRIIASDLREEAQMIQAFQSIYKPSEIKAKVEAN